MSLTLKPGRQVIYQGTKGPLICIWLFKLTNGDQHMLWHKRATIKANSSSFKIDINGLPLEGDIIIVKDTNSEITQRRFIGFTANGKPVCENKTEAGWTTSKIYKEWEHVEAENRRKQKVKGKIAELQARLAELEAQLQQS